MWENPFKTLKKYRHVPKRNCYKIIGVMSNYRNCTEILSDTIPSGLTNFAIIEM